VKKGLTEVVLVLDRSGSMESTKSDAEGGLREFIRKQKLVPGQCDVTFYRFDNEIERVFDKLPIERVEDARLKLDPRGSTALLDAMGKAIDEVGRRLRDTKEDERPEKVYVVTITDGEENCSTKHSYSMLAEKIKRQTDEYGWEFVFIGAGQDAIATASKINIAPQYSMSYSGSRVGTVNAYQILTNNVARSRTGAGDLSFSVEDRTSAMTK
jgi:uncharacterized protein YegL